MRVGIIQPNFVPWRGYFDFIRSVDVFILLDDVQYTKQDWRSRNRIKTRQGAAWLTVPVRVDSLNMKINEVVTDEVRGWRRKHMGTWQANYASAPWFGDICDILACMDAGQDYSLLQLNLRLMRRICAYLKIETPLVLASSYAVTGERTQRLISLLQAVGASLYLSGPSADNYLDKALFAEQGIALEYKSYDYLPYAQLWGEFDGAVSVLDLIANCGPNASHYLSSQTPDRVIVEAGSPVRVPS